uniref:Galactosidase, beta 1-like n=1 Tax=Astyanax mexicanus TaxID=7994 RepID=A0A3B1IU17_ASTMX
SKNLNTVTTTSDVLNRSGSDCFLKDGKPFQYISGSIHYSRVPRSYWKDRLTKMYMSGLNAIQVYIPWNFHESEQGVFEFEGEKDVEYFLNLANQTGLLVILRPGPYICAEWEMGGLPAWLLHNPNIILRSADSDYLQAVSDWMAVLLTKMRPWLYQNGGNIISVQVENEYGSYFACDYNYLRHLRTLFRFFLGEDVFLFTTDGNTDKELICGTLEGLYATIDFGTDTNITTAFKRQRRFEPKGPPGEIYMWVCVLQVNSEFYTGWLDHWGDKHASVETQKVSRMLEDMLSMGASVNMWVKVLTIVFSADLDSRFPGDPTDKLLAIRDVIKNVRRTSSPKFSYGFVTLKKVGNVSGLLDTLCPQGPVQSHHPLTFEEIKHYYGFMLYRTLLPRNIPDPTPLISPMNGIHDRAYVSVNGVYQGVLERDVTLVMNVTGRQGDQLDILVENMGRVNFGNKINDYKGLLGNLILGNDVLTDWLIFPLDLDAVISGGWPQAGGINVPPKPKTKEGRGPAVYSGILKTPGVAWEHLSQNSPGQVWINGVNLGRYWPKRGPQQTLYVPGTLLSPSLPNNITMLELESEPDHLRVLFMDRPQSKGNKGIEK